MKLNLVKTSDFVFRTKLFRVYDMELPFVEHLEELRQRIFQKSQPAVGYFHALV